MNRLSVSTLRRLGLAIAVLASFASSNSHAQTPPTVVAGTFQNANSEVNQGVAAASFVIPLPPARGNASVSLSVAYSGSTAVGEAGYGFQLAGLSRIERDPTSGWPTYNDPAPGDAMNPLGTPAVMSCTASGPKGEQNCTEITPATPPMDRFVVDGEPLIPICTVSWGGCPTKMPTWAEKDGGWHYFRTQHDDFREFFWHPNGRTWREIDKNGNTFEYGDALVATEIPSSGPATDDDATTGKTFRWLNSRRYDSVRDSAGSPVNLIVYRWSLHGLRRELDEIFFTPSLTQGVNKERSYAHHVALTYEPLFGVPQMKNLAPIWHAGHTERIRTIDVASMLGADTGNRTMVRRFSLGYESVSWGNRAHLHTLTMTGRCAGSPGLEKQTIATFSDKKYPVDRLSADLGTCDTLPPVVLTYATPSGGPTVWSKIEGAFSDPTSTSVLDVTGDGLADLVLPPTNGTAAQIVYENQGSSFRLLSIATPDADIASRLLAPTRGSSFTGAWSSFGNASVFLQTPNPCGGGTCVAMKNEPILAATLLANGGWQWQKTRSFLGQPFSGVDQLGDIDGDGFLDRRVLHDDPAYANCEQEVSFSDRDRKSIILPHPSRRTCGNRPDGEIVTWDEKAKTTLIHAKALRRFLGDMNGDGLADLIAYWGFGLDQSGPVFSVFPGDGTGNFYDPYAGSGREIAGYQVSGMPSSTEFHDLTDLSRLHVQDINGDGLADIVIERPNDKAGDGKSNLWIGLNQGAASFTWFSAMYPSGLSLAQNRIVFGDFNGNGSTDIALVSAQGLQYIESGALIPDHLLVGVDNGLGAVTSYTYASTATLDKQASPSWSTHAPSSAFVVTSMTHQVSGSSRTSEKHTTSYSYRDPAWGGFRHRLKGFARIETTVQGDANEPSTTVDDRYSFSPCDQIPVLGYTPADPARHCGGEAVLDDDPEDATGGWLVASSLSDGKTVLKSTTWHAVVALNHILRGLDERHVRFAYVNQIDTLLGDSATLGIRTGTVTVHDAAKTTIIDLPSHEETQKLDVTVLMPAAAGMVHLRQRAAFDETNGNQTFAYDDGRISENGSVHDETITTETTWDQVSPESNWLWRAKTQTVHAFAQASGLPTPTSRTIRHTYTPFGQLDETSGDLSGSIPLTRFHVDSKPIAPAPSTASGDGTIKFTKYVYDAAGNVKRTTDAAGACIEMAYDDAYGEFPALTTVHMDPGCNGTEINGWINLYDRGFGAATELVNAQKSTTRIKLDAFGRTTDVLTPDPATGLPTLARTTAYALGGANGGWIIHTTSTVDTSAGAAFPKSETWLYTNGDGTPVLSLTPGDAADTYIASGLLVRTAKGSVLAVPQPWAYAGKPELHTLAPPAGERTTRVSLDAYGRVLESFGLDNETKGRVTYHALGIEQRDAESLSTAPNAAHVGTLSGMSRDGHGRVERTFATVKNADNAWDTIEKTFSYQASGELVRLTQAHALGGGKDSVVRWMQYDSLGRLVLNAEPNTTKNFTPTPTDTGAVNAMRTWRYAYDDASRLVGISDPRGCGENLFYDVMGHLVAEDYSPCTSTQAPYSAPNLETGDGTELFNVYDAYARLASHSDLGASATFAYDYRGRGTGVGKRIVKPGAPSPKLSERFASWTFRNAMSFDVGNRPVRVSSGADVAELLANDPELGTPASDVVFRYGARDLARIDSSYGTLMKSQAVDVDGFVTEAIFGNKAEGDVAETRLGRTPDSRRRVGSYVLEHPNAPANWASSAPGQSSRQIRLAAATYKYDEVDNVISAHDDRVIDPFLAEWGDGSKPVSRTMAYDDLYRLKSIDYAYAAGTDKQVDAYAHERANAATKSLVAPSSVAGARVLNQTFKFDWKGNSTKTSDNANTFFDRSLGEITNGESIGKPNQLVSSVLKDAAGKSIGSVAATYDDAGNLVQLLEVRSSCTDPAGLCAQMYVYEWDEIGNVARARRWDRTSASGFGDITTAQPAAELRYAYGGSTRVVKTAVQGAEERHTVDVFPSLRLTHAKWVPAAPPDGTTSVLALSVKATKTASSLARSVPVAPPCNDCTPPAPPPSTDGDYERTALTEQVYLAGLAHVTVFADGVSSGDPSTKRHVFLMLGDELGSTSVVVDKKSAELVERTTYQAFGAPDSDYRPERWGGFREDFHFTGKEDDAEVGLTYFGARYYSAPLGRWISADPLAVHRAGADLNVYAYVHGSPTMRVDPNGLEDDGPPIIVPLAPPPPCECSGGGGGGGSSGGNWQSPNMVTDAGAKLREEKARHERESQDNARDQALRNNVSKAAPTRVVPFDNRQGSILDHVLLDGNDSWALFVQDDAKMEQLQITTGKVAVVAFITVGTVGAGGAAASAAGLSADGVYATVMVNAGRAGTVIVDVLGAEHGLVTVGAGGGAMMMARAEEEAAPIINQAASRAIRQVEPGAWAFVRDVMSARASIFQSQVSGQAPGVAYVVRGVAFDGIKDGVLLEAKGPGYASLLTEKVLAKWSTAMDGILDQAQRQVAAAGGTPIRWVFAEKAAADAVRSAFKSAGLPIQVVTQ